MYRLIFSDSVHVSCYITINFHANANIIEPLREANMLQDVNGKCSLRYQGIILVKLIQEKQLLVRVLL